KAGSSLPMITRASDPPMKWRRVMGFQAFAELPNIAFSVASRTVRAVWLEFAAEFLFRARVWAASHADVGCPAAAVRRSWFDQGAGTIGRTRRFWRRVKGS